MTVGGVEVAMSIDSGASTNFVDRNLGSKRKQEKIKRASKKSDKKLYGYDSKQPLKVLEASLTLANAEKDIVINGEDKTILGRETACHTAVCLEAKCPNLFIVI